MEGREDAEGGGDVGVEASEGGEPGRRPPQRERPARRRRHGRTALLLALRLLVLAAVFLVGLVVGRAIEDAPRPGGSQTGIRTLEVATVGPAAATTVTVTTP